MKSALLATVALCASCCSVPAGSARIESQLNVWRVVGDTGSGSATPIRVEDGVVWFLTAAHMLPSTSWRVIARDGRTLDDGVLLSKHPDEDALILVFPLEPGETVGVVPLSFEPLSLGAEVFGSGFAGGTPHQWLTEGLVSGSRRTTTPIAPGDSGGGLFDQQGRQVAILVGRYSVTDAHLAAVVPLAAIEDWLRENLK